MFQNSFLKKVQISIIKQKRALQVSWFLVFLFIIIDIFVVGHYALGRYNTYHALAFDLGNMDQAVWNTLHGHPFRFTNRGDDWQGPPTRLGAHVEPILLLIAPFYLIHSGPQTLLILQTTTLALGAIPLFLLARRKLPTMPFVGVAFVAAYLVSPEVLGEGIFDFHPVTLTTPLLLLAILALDSKKYRLFTIAAILAAFCKEEVALSLIPLGLYIAFWQKRKLFGITTAGVSLLWVILCFFVIIPHYSGDILGNYRYRYEWIGDSTPEIINDIFTKPTNILQNIDTNSKQKYLTLLLRTGGGLSILSPFLLLGALPEIIINIFSSKWEQFIGLYQYNAVIIPFIMAASVFGASELYKTKSEKSNNSKNTFYSYWQKALRLIPIPAKAISIFIILCLIITTYLNIISLQDGLRLFFQNDNQSRPEQTKIDQLLRGIPSTASVATMPTLNAHLSDRYTVFLLPDQQAYSAEYVAIDNADSLEMQKSEVKQMTQKMLNSSNYQMIGTVGQVIVLKHLQKS
jgi:uncharacterized membrane protein